MMGHQTETWKSIVGYEGIYEVGESGQVKSLPRIKYCGHPGATQKVKERILVKTIDRNGYVRVNLSKNGAAKLFHLHRIVALTFLDNLEGKREVNHIDGDKNNNNTSNLEWVTRSENMRHAFRNNLLNPRVGENNNKSKLTAEKVKEIRKLRSNGSTLQKIADQYGVSAANISEIVNFKTWKGVM